MSHQAKNLIDRILDQTHSLDDLTSDTVIELRRISDSSLVLDKFNVSPAAFWNWYDKLGDDTRGIEYDAQNARIVLKEYLGWMHEAVTGVVNGFLGEIRRRLNDATGLWYHLVGSTDCLLDGDFDGSTKQADASLMALEDEWPAVVLEVGISETTSNLYKDAERWLKGSNHQTKLVILVDVEETPRWKNSDNTSNWGLCETDFQQTNHRRLTDHILQWYRSNQIRLHGSFKLSVHLWYSDGDQQCILNKAAFSPDNLIDIKFINDVPLRMELLLPNGSDSAVSQQLSFPLKDLVNILQRGFGKVEIQRARHLAKNKLKK